MGDAASPPGASGAETASRQSRCGDGGGVPAMGERRKMKAAGAGEKKFCDVRSLWCVG